ncbi:MAG: right-handed parallel beta-helix repeat-containing protein [Armatimonadetes bacterium]|nr:right-handed parallel beta-helix repeat-containing protein [Armatimonadota bacterium]
MIAYGIGLIRRTDNPWGKPSIARVHTRLARIEAFKEAQAMHVKAVVFGTVTWCVWAAGFQLTPAAAVPIGPSTLQGLYLWYKADSIAGMKDGGIVTQWRDSGPRKIHLNRHSGSPTFVGKAINQLPVVRFREGQAEGLRTTATVEALAGNPKVTVFLVAKVAKPNGEYAQPLGWGNGGARAGAALFLEFQASRLDFGTGFSADAMTPDGAYADCFGKPTLILCAKSAGPMKSTTRIAFNGTAAPVAGSTLIPSVLVTPFNVGGDAHTGYVSPAMDVAEIIIYNRLLSLREQNSVGFYLKEKYAIKAGYIKPEEFIPMDLVVSADPPEVRAVVGFVGRGQHIKGATVDVAAQETVVLRDATGQRLFRFDRWDGDVADRGSSTKTTVRMNKAKTITAVYKEKKMEFFVATRGNDSWSGTLAKPSAAGTDGPFATLARARDALRQVKMKSGGQLPAPVKVIARGGKYSLAEPLVLAPDDSGTQDSPITYTAYPGEKPILSGGRVVTGWRLYKGDILQADLPDARGGKWKFRQLFYNGKGQVRARTPNFDLQNPLKGGWASMEGPAEPGSQTAFKYKPGTLEHQWAKPTQAEVNLFIGYDWANNIIPIKTVDEQNRVITLTHSTTQFTNPPLPFNYPTPFNPNQRFRVENVLEELDQPGEWCLDSEEGKLYFWPPDESIEQTEVVVPLLEGLVALHGASYLTISGFTFTETNGGDNFHHEGCEGVGAMFPMPGWKYCGDVVHLKGAEHCRIQDNRFHNVGGNGVYLEGHNARNIIRRNEIGQVGACGVCLAGAGDQYPIFNEIVDNHIHDTGLMYTYSAGVFAGLSEGNVIGHNLIEHVPHHAINLGNTGRSHNIVEYNEIRHTCQETSDTGAINCWMEAGERNSERQGHIIRYNHIADSHERGIYLDNYTSNCHVYGNIIVRARHWAIIAHGGKNNVVENNVIAGCTHAALAVYDGIDGLMPHMALFSSGNRFYRNIIFNTNGVLFLEHKRPDHAVAQSDYNLFFNTGDERDYLGSQQQKGHELHSVIADPLFVDPAKDDFRLKPGSVAFELGFEPIPVTKIGKETK